jgi:DNA-binding CsgD family transcriptional regulator
MTLLELEYALEQDIFEGMIEKYGYKGLGKMINKLDSFKRLQSAYPMDKWDRIYSLDRMFEEGQSVPDGLDEPLTVAIGHDIVRVYRASLTPRQTVIIDMLASGYSQSEIADYYGFKNTQIVRYQKHQAKIKWHRANHESEL